jgi:hypothetical protein
VVVDSASRRLLRREPDGSMPTQASVAPISEKPWNDIVVDAHGNAYVNNIGFDFPPVPPGSLARNCARNVVSRRRLQAPLWESHTATTAKWDLRRGGGTGIFRPGRNGGR